MDSGQLFPCFTCTRHLSACLARVRLDQLGPCTVPGVPSASQKSCAGKAELGGNCQHTGCCLVPALGGHAQAKCLLPPDVPAYSACGIAPPTCASQTANR